MKSSIEKFSSGWSGIKIALAEQDIDTLINYLKCLKENENYHFHMFSTAFDDEINGIADIEFSRKFDEKNSNMELGA